MRRAVSENISIIAPKSLNVEINRHIRQMMIPEASKPGRHGSFSGWIIQPANRSFAVLISAHTRTIGKRGGSGSRRHIFYTFSGICFSYSFSFPSYSFSALKERNAIYKIHLLRVNHCPQRGSGSSPAIGTSNQFSD